AFDPNLNLMWSTYHGSNVTEFSGGISSLDADQRIVVVGSGWSADIGEHVYDPNSFDPTEYYMNSELDYYQNAINISNTSNGYGAIFNVGELNNPVSVHDTQVTDQNVKFWPNPTTNLLNIVSTFNL